MSREATLCMARNHAGWAVACRRSSSGSCQRRCAPHRGMWGAADQQSRTYQRSDHDPAVRLGCTGTSDPMHRVCSSSGSIELPVSGSSAGLFMIVTVVVRVVSGGRSALTGRVGRHSTAGLAVVAAASLVLAQLDEGIGHSHPQLHREGRVIGGPVGQESPRVWPRPGSLT